MGLVVQKFGDIGESMKMFLKLALRNQKEHDEIHGLIVERVEVDSFFRAAERTDDFINQIGGGVGDADAEPDAGAHRSFPFLDDGSNRLAMFGFDFPCDNKVVDQFIDGFPSGGSLQIGKDLIVSENVSQIHKKSEPLHFA